MRYSKSVILLLMFVVSVLAPGCVSSEEKAAYAADGIKVIKVATWPEFVEKVYSHQNHQVGVLYEVENQGITCTSGWIKISNLPATVRSTDGKVTVTITSVNLLKGNESVSFHLEKPNKAINVSVECGLWDTVNQVGSNWDSKRFYAPIQGGEGTIGCPMAAKQNYGLDEVFIQVSHWGN